MLKAKKQQIAMELQEFGMAVGKVQTDAKHSRVLSCGAKGHRVFLAVFGSIDSLMSAFSISYNKPLVCGVLLVLSIFAGCMYLNKLCFYLGYLVLVLLFSIEAIRYQRYVNSGYQAILNLIHKEYSEYFDLGVNREATELFSNRYLTISLLLIFIGFAFVLLLNIAISGYMSVLATVLLTLPIVEVALFVGKVPRHLPLCMLGSVYITVAFLQCSRNFRMLVKFKNNTEYLKKRRKNRIIFNYQGSGASILFLLAAGFCLSFLTLLVLKPMQKVEDKERINQSVLRQKLDEKVETFVLSGLSGFFDRYNATGGLSSGRLGGVSSVRPDFQTDFYASFVPYSLDTVYLRSFIGTEYTGNSFLSTVSIPGEKKNEQTIFTLERLDKYEKELTPRSSAEALFKIEDVDIRRQVPLLPYTSFRENAEKVGNLSTIQFFPYFGQETRSIYTAADMDYLSYVYLSCCSLTDSQVTYLHQWSIENGIPWYNDLLKQPGYDEASAKRKVAEAIRAVFYEKYPYTMSPGATKRNEDFVEFFLTKQKRGYCAHFAAASVLLLRAQGIPARYVEGYCMPNSLVADGTVLSNERPADWYKGESKISVENVVKVEVSDAYAHAWTEIFIDGYGFEPFDFTPPSDREENLSQTSFFARLFSSLFQSVNLNANGKNPGDEGSIIEDDFNENDRDKDLTRFSLSSVSIFFPVLIFLLTAVLLFILYIVLRFLYISFSVKRMWKQGRYEDITAFYYRRLVQKLLKRTATTEKNPIPERVLTLLNEKLPEQKEENHRWLQFAERAAFSGEGVTKEEAEAYVLRYQIMCKELSLGSKTKLSHGTK